MSFITLSGVLSADVADAGTFVVSLPINQAGQNLSASQASFPVNGGDFFAGFGHRISLGAQANGIGGGDSYQHPQKMDVGTLTSSTVTVTNRSGVAWRAGTAYRLQLEMQGFRFYQDNDPQFARRLSKITEAKTYLINLGMPTTASATAVAAAQAIASATNAVINGANASGGVAYLDVPRNLQFVSSGAGDTTQTITAFGTDQYGAALRESIALNGITIVQGNKAFSTVTRVASSAALAGTLSVGNSTKIGLPVFVPNVAHVVREILDGAVATAGTFVGGMTTGGGSTLTTADVRGTYIPNSAPNGARVFQLIVSLPDAGNLGAPQFNG